jgi:hypothetical protein
MTLRLLPLRTFKSSVTQGIATLIVFIAILVISLTAAAVLYSQKNLYTAIEKVENQGVQMDVADICMKAAVNDLIAKSAISQLSTSTTIPVDVTATAQSMLTPYVTQIDGAVSSSNPNAASIKAQYSSANIISCKYLFMIQRQVSNSGVLGGDVTLSRAYGNTAGSENVYKITVNTCANSSNPCTSMQTNSNFYVGIQ